MEYRKYLFRFQQILCQMANKMLSQRISESITVDFVECMIPHHQAAIYMCQNLLEYTNYEPLQKMAKRIIQEQTVGIEQMKEIAKTTSGFKNSKKEVNCYWEKYFAITKNMIHKMNHSPRSRNINLNFTNEMIPHHEGAIAMCENLLLYCIDPRLKDVAENIIKEQSQGVMELKEIRGKLCQKA